MVTRALLLLATAMLGSSCQPPCGRDEAPVDAQAGPGGGGNLLVVVLDDVGVEQLTAYGLGKHTARTPTIDCLCERGLRFDQVWASPSCSPARAELLTGRYNRRTGIGSIFGPRTTNGHEMPTEEDTLPRVLSRAGYRTGLFGKWHLTDPNTPDAATHPNRSGFERFAGSIGNLNATTSGERHQFYSEWERVADGAAAMTTRYPTVQLVDDALDFVDEVEGEPWLVVLSFQSPHVPLHWPPGRLWRDVEPGYSVDHQRYLAMVESVDHELGRFLRRLPRDVRADTTVVLTSDNGSHRSMVDPTWPIRGAKTTVYELGVRVPLVVTGPALSAGRGESTDALAHLVDVLPTFAEIAGAVPEADLDGVSLGAVLADPAADARTTVATAKFLPMGLDRPHRPLTRAIRDATHKLVVNPDGREELFLVGPEVVVEGDDLLRTGVSAEDQAHLEALRDALAEVEEAVTREVDAVE